jgi:hypothetical protein
MFAESCEHRLKSLRKRIEHAIITNVGPRLMAWYGDGVSPDSRVELGRVHVEEFNPSQIRNSTTTFNTECVLFSRRHVRQLKPLLNIIPSTHRGVTFYIY